MQIFNQSVKMLEAGDRSGLDMERNDITRVALEWAPQGRRKVGRPTENWTFGLPSPSLRTVE